MQDLKDKPPAGLTFPVPCPPRPSKPRSQGSRSRHRFAKRMMLWSLTSHYIVGLNTLFNKHKPHGQIVASLGDCSPAQQSILTRAFAQCQKLCRERRAFVSTGAQAARSLVKSMSAGSYTSIGPSISQVSFIAAAIAEPPPDSSVVDMLQALPAEESLFYSLEENVLQSSGIVPSMLQEWVNFLNRADVPQDMWEYRKLAEVKARADVSAVAKKDKTKLRKLIMACPANYLWKDPRSRRNHGLGGASALSGLSTWGQELNFDIFDESSAFTYVRTPRWMWSYYGRPSVQAKFVWSQLPQNFRQRVHADEWIVPCYTRLPMGSSHSVHI